MNTSARPSLKSLQLCLVAFAIASLVHFVHNAEFLKEYPGLPESWTSTTVYGAWLALSAVGLIGWLAMRAGYAVIGLVLLGGYAAGGMDSLGHYWVAPWSAHSTAMNLTIALEVGTATLLFIDVLRRLVLRMQTARVVRGSV